MPHTFQRREEEPEPEAGGSRLGGPPRKHTAAGILDPPVPPKRSPAPSPAIPHPIIKILALAFLVGIAAIAILYFYFKFR